MKHKSRIMNTEYLNYKFKITNPK